jgi:hypothetical protein
MGRYDEVSGGSFPGLSIEISQTYFHTVREVKGEEDGVENQDQEGYRSLCFKDVFGIPFGPGVMMYVKLLIAY